MSEASNIATLERAVAHFNNPASRESYFELYTESTVLHGCAGVEPGGPTSSSFTRQSGRPSPMPPLKGRTCLRRMTRSFFALSCTAPIKGILWASPQQANRLRCPASRSCASLTANASSGGARPISWRSCNKSARCLPPRNQQQSLLENIYVGTSQCGTRKNHLRSVQSRRLSFAADDVEITLMPFGQTFTGHEGF